METLIHNLANEFFYSFCAMAFCLGFVNSSILFYLAFRDAS